jgi:hypothetical protein
MDSKKGCKTLVADYFKFQKGQCDDLDLNTSEKLTHNLNLIIVHAENMWKIN